MAAAAGTVGGLQAGARPLARADAALARLAWLGLLAHAAFVPVSIAGMQIGLGVSAGAVLLRAALGRRPDAPAGLGLPLVLLAGAAALSIPLAWAAGSPPPGLSGLDYFRGLLAPLAVLLGLGAGLPGEPADAPRRRALRLAAVLAAAALLPAAVAWPQALDGGFDLFFLLGLREAPEHVALFPSGRVVASGFQNGHARFGLTLAPIAALAGTLALLAPLRRGLRVLLGASAIAATAAIALSTTRSALGALGVAAVVAAAASGRRGAARGALAVAALGAAAAVALSPVLRDRIAADGATGRGKVWAVCADVVRDHPLAGVGFGALKAKVGPYWAGVDPIFGQKTQCHDVFLTALAEGGPLLLAAMAAFWALCTRAFLRWRASGDALGRAGAVAGLAVLAGGLVASLVHDVFWVVEPALAFGLALSVAAVVARPPGGGGR